MLHRAAIFMTDVLKTFLDVKCNVFVIARCLRIDSPSESPIILFVVFSKLFALYGLGYIQIHIQLFFHSFEWGIPPKTSNLQGRRRAGSDF